jgi:6-pyruvoyltetrahydropterin/6-carboxytetrahydropterin synthase
MVDSNLPANHVELVREYRFEAAHRLPKVPPGHRCARLHGHSYRVEVAVRGPVDEETGWLIDFYAMDSVVAPAIEALDHRLLNELPGLENPTCEMLCRYLWKQLREGLVGLSAITVWETLDSRCSYRG